LSRVRNYSCDARKFSTLITVRNRTRVTHLSQQQDRVAFPITMCPAPPLAAEISGTMERGKWVDGLTRSVPAGWKYLQLRELDLADFEPISTQPAPRFPITATRTIFTGPCHWSPIGIRWDLAARYVSRFQPSRPLCNTRDRVSLSEVPFRSKSRLLVSKTGTSSWHVLFILFLYYFVFHRKKSLADIQSLSDKARR
jgi:hypothetical protein